VSSGVKNRFSARWLAAGAMVELPSPDDESHNQDPAHTIHDDEMKVAI
jgi:hypothetical protein